MYANVGICNADVSFYATFILQFVAFMHFVGSLKAFSNFLC